MGALWQTDSNRAALATDSPDQPPLPQSPRSRRLWWRLVWLILLIALAALCWAASQEMRTSRLQAEYLSPLAAALSYEVTPGTSEAVVYPGDGPFDKRLGYSDLDEFLPRLLKRNYLVQAQARFSPALMDYA